MKIDLILSILFFLLVGNTCQQVFAVEGSHWARIVDNQDLASANVLMGVGSFNLGSDLTQGGCPAENPIPYKHDGVFDYYHYQQFCNFNINHFAQAMSDYSEKAFPTEHLHRPIYLSTERLEYESIQASQYMTGGGFNQKVSRARAALQSFMAPFTSIGGQHGHGLTDLLTAQNQVAPIGKIFNLDLLSRDEFSLGHLCYDEGNFGDGEIERFRLQIQAEMNRILGMGKTHCINFHDSNQRSLGARCNRALSDYLPANQQGITESIHQFVGNNTAFLFDYSQGTDQQKSQSILLKKCVQNSCSFGDNSSKIAIDQNVTAEAFFGAKTAQLMGVESSQQNITNIQNIINRYELANEMEERLVQFSEFANQLVLCADPSAWVGPKAMLAIADCGVALTKSYEILNEAYLSTSENPQQELAADPYYEGDAYSTGRAAASAGVLAQGAKKFARQNPERLTQFRESGRRMLESMRSAMQGVRAYKETVNAADKVNKMRQLGQTFGRLKNSLGSASNRTSLGGAVVFGLGMLRDHWIEGRAEERRQNINELEQSLSTDENLSRLSLEQFRQMNSRLDVLEKALHEIDHLKMELAKRCHPEDIDALIYFYDQLAGSPHECAQFMDSTLLSHFQRLKRKRESYGAFNARREGIGLEGNYTRLGELVDPREQRPAGRREGGPETLAEPVRQIATREEIQQQLQQEEDARQQQVLASQAQVQRQKAQALNALNTAQTTADTEQALRQIENLITATPPGLTQEELNHILQRAISFSENSSTADQRGQFLLIARKIASWSDSEHQNMGQNAFLQLRSSSDTSIKRRAFYFSVTLDPGGNAGQAISRAFNNEDSATQTWVATAAMRVAQAKGSARERTEYVKELLIQMDQHSSPEMIQRFLTKLRQQNRNNPSLGEDLERGIFDFVSQKDNQSRGHYVDLLL